MATDTVTVKFKVLEDGSLQAVGKHADKAAAGLNNASNSADRYNKVAKGAAGATSNSTKAFSKMSTGITGGLVPAYAVLAANIFALTAAFGALRRAAATQQLEEGLIRVGNAAGANLTYVAENIRDITGAAISMEAAMSSTALAFSSGFSSTQLEDLTKVAKGASQALGRDMEDALTRLVKGTAKLEPEILDELGIMVRLDDAVDAYAVTIGKTGDQLTQFERRQAFLNATTEQGLKKFGDIAETLDPNAYDQLAAAFTNLSKTGLNLINTVLTPLVSFLGANPTALTGVLFLFGSTILKTILPAIGQMSESFSRSATAAGATAKKASKVVSKAYTDAATKVSKELTIIPKGIQNLTTKIKSGTLSINEQAKVLKSLKASEAIRVKQTAAGLGEVKKARQDNLDIIRKQIVAVQKLQEAEKTKSVITNKGVIAAGRSRSSTITSAALNRMEAANGVLAKFRVALTGTALQMKTVGRVNGSLWAKVVIGATAARGAVVLFGTALLNAIPVIGQVLFVASLLIPVFKKLFGDSELEKTLTGITDSFESFVSISDQLEDTLKKTDSKADAFVATLKAKVGIIDQLIDGWKKYTAAVREASREDRIKAQEDLDAANRAKRESETKSGQGGVNSGALGAGRGTATLDARGKAFDSAVTGAESKVDSLNTGIEELNKAAAKIFIQDALASMNAMAPKLKKELTPQIALLTKELKLLEEDSYRFKTNTGFQEFFDGFMGNNKSIIESIMGAQTTMADFQASVNKLGARKSTPYDPIIENLKLLSIEFNNAAAAGGQAIQAFKNNAIGFQDTIDAMRSVLPDTLPGGLPKSLLGDAGVLMLSVKQLEKSRDTLITAKALIKQQQIEFKKLNAISKDNPLIMQRALDMHNQIVDSRKNAVQEEINLIDLSGISVLDQEKLLQLQQELKAIEAERLGTAQIAASVKVADVKQQMLINTLVNKELNSRKAMLAASIALQQNALKRKAATNRFDTSSQDEMKSFNENKQARLDMITQETKAKVETIKLQWDLLGAQLALEKAKAARTGASAEELKIFEKLAGLQEQARNGATAAAITTGVVAKDNIETEGVVKSRATLDASTSNSGSQGERISGLFGAGGALDPDQELSSIGDKVAGTINALQPMMDLMGPEGLLLNAVTSGAAAATGAWSTAFEIIGDSAASGGDRLAAGLEASSATIGAISSMLAANSQQKITSIDQEIAAEQKRDGKSAASLAKLSALDKKKEKEKKKAFEINKKAQMAQTILSTASAVIQSIANAGGLPFGIATGAAMAAVGAAQLAIIAGTSYQGGGSAGGSTPTAPSTLEVGSRSNTVDLANANNAGGELAYARGASGTGTGMDNFKPTSAFSGYKGRAAGGYLVGEQGPEVFMPETAGNIIPSGKETGGMTNVNFSISAVDASGVEDLLMNQRGNIIAMLREAANEHGQMFLEGVQDKSY